MANTYSHPSRPLIQFKHIQAAQQRISADIHLTPIVESHQLNLWLGSRVLFKAECLQRTGAFKLRGAMNLLSRMVEQNTLPDKVVANSSGNHAQAVACAAAKFKLPATIFCAQGISAVKAAATEYYGAKLRHFATRVQADEAVRQAAQAPNTLWIPPFDHPDIISGQGTLIQEALKQTSQVDAVFAPCGGGGLLSGTLIATRALCPHTKVIGAEPLTANDAAESRRQGKIMPLSQTPKTLADGAATPSVGTHTFPYLQQLDALYEVTENRIAYWTQWLQHLLKLHVEPTSAMSMQAVQMWLAQMPKGQTVLVLLTGGNIDQQKMQQIWQQDHLLETPGLGSA